MGRDKALVELAGRPLIVWALDVLRGAGLAAKIAGARTDLSTFAPVAPDAWDNVGPLGGVCSALRLTTQDWAAFVTVDQPVMSPALVRGLLDEARKSAAVVTVASVDGMAQTFPAVVRRSALEVLEGRLEDGRLGCIDGFRAAGLRVVTAEDLAPPESRSLVDRWFSNVNTPEDLERVKSLLRAGGSDRSKTDSLRE
jgi:molybdopterin-guanine dinucleotide biosynthesis protein A